MEVKEKLAVALNNFLEPIRERRATYEAQTGYVDELLYEGTLRAAAGGPGHAAGGQEGHGADGRLEPDLAGGGEATQA